MRKRLGTLAIKSFRHPIREKAAISSETELLRGTSMKSHNRRTYGGRSHDDTGRGSPLEVTTYQRAVRSDAPPRAVVALVVASRLPPSLTPWPSALASS